MTHDAINWGILSTSTVATGKAIPALKRCANAKVIAIASRDFEKAEGVARSFDIPNAYGSYDALLQDPEVRAVYLSLPNGLHGEWTVRAAKAGKHVLCEKPAALSPDVAEDMIAAWMINNVLFMEGFMYRFHPQFDCVKRWLAEERIGTLRLIRVSFSFPLEPRHSRIRLRASLGVGALADVGAYGVDVIRWLIGAEPCRVFASGRRGFEADVETNFAAILQYASGMRAILDGGLDCPRHNRCEIVGEGGTITITSPFIAVEGAAVRLWTPTSDEARTFPLVDLFQIQFEHFSALVLGSGTPAISADETVGNARVLAALRASVNSGSPVDIPRSAADRCGEVSGDQSRDKRNEQE
jgi:D-xylose 1-dehydrogenase (NADP+, D-xylono-1,5-lactone-forming)